MTIIHQKYPRTLHLPWSLSITTDDKILPSTKPFIGEDVVVSVKQDGENTSLYTDHYHARSLDSRHHPSRNWIKEFHASRKADIPDDIRICGENMYASHSIYYKNLPSYFMAFSVWDNEKNICLSWDETIEYLSLLDIQPVPVIYRGVFDEEKIKEAWETFCKENHLNSSTTDEGYVVRLAKSFPYADFKKSVSKFVRMGHVQTSSHWMTEKVIPNSVVSENDQVKEDRYQEFVDRQLKNADPHVESVTKKKVGLKIS